MEFRVSAINDGGAGKPSKATSPLVVKDPTCECSVKWCANGASTFVNHSTSGCT